MKLLALQGMPPRGMEVRSLPAPEPYRITNIKVPCDSQKSLIPRFQCPTDRRATDLSIRKQEVSLDTPSLSYMRHSLTGTTQNQPVLPSTTVPKALLAMTLDDFESSSANVTSRIDLRVKACTSHRGPNRRCRTNNEAASQHHLQSQPCSRDATRCAHEQREYVQQ